MAVSQDLEPKTLVAWSFVHVHWSTRVPRFGPHRAIAIYIILNLELDVIPLQHVPAPSNRSPPDTFKSTKATRGDLLEAAGII